MMFSTVLQHNTFTLTGITEQIIHIYTFHNDEMSITRAEMA